jgi:cytidine deaminase
MNDNELVNSARRAHGKAYAPYSGFAVGAAVLSQSGDVFVGCNVENLSLGLTICAERAAVANAIVAGHREFKALALVAASKKPPVPCGACRQVLAEFNPDLKILASTTQGAVQEFKLVNLLPNPKQGILGLG